MPAASGRRRIFPRPTSGSPSPPLPGDKDAASRRDEVAALLDQDQLALARAAVKAWRPKTPPAAANTVTLPAGGWGSVADGVTARGVTAEDQSALVRKIQTLLAEQGYDPGPADGVAGAEDPRCGARLPGARSASPTPDEIDRLAGHRARRSNRLTLRAAKWPPLR